MWLAACRGVVPARLGLGSLVQHHALELRQSKEAGRSEFKTNAFTQNKTQSMHSQRIRPLTSRNARRARGLEPGPPHLPGGSLTFCWNHLIASSFVTRCCTPTCSNTV